MPERYVKRVLTQEDFRIIRADLMLNPNKVSSEPVCDFCSDPHPITIYSAKQMSTGEKQRNLRWCACLACDTAIERADWDTLKYRQMKRAQVIAERQGIDWNAETKAAFAAGMELSLADFRRYALTEQVVSTGSKQYGFTSKHLEAIEARLKWLKWCIEGQAYNVLSPVSYAQGMAGEHKPNYDVLPMYEKVLAAGDTFYMNPRFCQLVDLARQTIPDETPFELDWLQAKQGWMWISEPFDVAQLDYRDITTRKITEEEAKRLTEVRNRISAIGWGINEEAHAVEIMCFEDIDLFNKRISEVYPEYPYRPTAQFNTYSFFGLRDGDRLIDRIRSFEQMAHGSDSGRYTADRTSDMKHEIRWVYTAFHMMAQRLAMTVREDANRQARRRLEREPERTQLPPFIKVITLRKLEADRKKAEEEGTATIDWQWQWEVVGHWRNQWYPSENIHKPKWIEAYIKGPDDKPLKPPSHRLFVAKR